MLSPSISAFASSDPAKSRSSAPVVVLVKPNRVGSLHWRTKLLKKFLLRQASKGRAVEGVAVLVELEEGL